MKTVLAVSSFVARGAVGLRAIVPALERLGVTALACPTVVLSSHLGHAHTAGAPMAAETLRSMFEALKANGWLESVDAVLTGYLPSVDHVRALETLIARVRARRPDALIICDPVLGDDPEGLYVPRPVAEAVRDVLVPRATHLKANRFELAFLSGHAVDTPAGVVSAARALGVPVVLTTSVPVPGPRLANVVVTRDGSAVCTVPRQDHAPHGTGDLMAALFTTHVLAGNSPDVSTGLAAAGVARAMAASAGRDELHLAGSADWQAPPPLPMQRVDSGND